MREMSEAGTLTEDSMLAVMCEQKKPCWDNITLKGQALRKYFPQSYTPLQIEKIIYRIKHNKPIVHSGQRIFTIPCPLFLLPEEVRN